MINILPPQYKEELSSQEQWRMFLNLGITILISLVCFSLILFSLEIIISAEAEAQKILFSQKENEYQLSQVQVFEDKINAYNKRLTELRSFYRDQVSFSEIVKMISDNLPVGTYLINLSIIAKTDKEKEIQCVVSGFSPTSEKLIEFKKNLEGEERFEEVNFPPSNWVSLTNINFSATFKVKQSEL